MGFTSFDCKHCSHPMLDPMATDKGINEWMSSAVMLTENGSRVIGEFNGEGHSVGGAELEYDAVYVHEACWRAAGKPDFEEYDGPSKHSDDQGWFFETGAHDMPEPGKTCDEEAWEKAKADRAEAIRRRRVEDAMEMIRGYVPEGDPQWKRRFTIDKTKPWHGEGADPWPDRVVGWYLTDNLWGYTEVAKGMETKEEAYAKAEALWNEWLASDEVKAMREEYAGWQREAHERFVQSLRDEGRFEVSYRPSPGDTITRENERTWTGSRSVYTVQDKMTYKEVMVCDGPLKEIGVKTYDGDADDHEPVWKARVEEFRAAMAASASQAKEACKRLQADWEARGCPDESDWNADEGGYMVS